MASEFARHVVLSRRSRLGSAIPGKVWFGRVRRGALSSGTLGHGVAVLAGCGLARPVAVRCGGRGVECQGWARKRLAVEDWNGTAS